MDEPEFVVPAGAGTQRVSCFRWLERGGRCKGSWILAFATTALVGLAVSLFTPRRRLWLRLTPDPGGSGRTVVAGAALARGDDVGLDDELARVMTAVRALDDAPATSAATMHEAASSNEAVATDERQDDEPG